MKCFVCGEEMTPYMEKKIAVKYLDGLDTFEYVRCPNCHLVVSKTLYEMSHEDWAAFNTAAHEDYFKGVLKFEELDPKWLERLELQAELFVTLLKLGVLKYDAKTIDYGAGDGKLADKINEKLGRVWLKKFDAYMKPLDENYLSADEVKPSSFDFLTSSSVFEHLLGNQGDVDNVIGLIKPDGIMALHTLICEEVPQDPTWYYLLPIPVHCTLWTNKAMALVYKKHGFKGCAYNVESRMWLMFRNVDDFNKLKENAAQLKGTWQFGDDFVDYWKVKPYRS